MPNRLIKASSPYLLQHANNPVDWFEWGNEALQKALLEDKPIIVSIGYSVCHWCHVMEKESFENEQIGQLMNEHFVCIKIDREERPDIDQIYMQAVQTMGIHGGWPLNVFLLPDQRPFYGGTYFRPTQWKALLEQIAEAYQRHQTELIESATAFTEALGTSVLDQVQGKAIYGLQEVFEKLIKKFDKQYGGLLQVPKFPMPCIWQFVLDYSFQMKEKISEAHTFFTLDAIATNGIYDQIGGGFARYSVDAQWFAPHFEKMLYDNAQLLSLYARAFAHTQAPFYQKIIAQTIHFIQTDLQIQEGACMSAFDADSEGIEGWFYLWSTQEIIDLLGQVDGNAFIDLYQMNQEGNWHEGRGKNILFTSKEKLASFSDEQTQKWAQILLEARNKRIRPALDDKVLLLWNALLISGLVDCSHACQQKQYADFALQIGDFIWKNMHVGNGQLMHAYKSGNAYVNAFLDDYASTMLAFIDLYALTFEQVWLEISELLFAHVLQNFRITNSSLFYYTSAQDTPLIVRNIEVYDNVIPSGNSMLALALTRLSVLTGKLEYFQKAEQMLDEVLHILGADLQFMTNWARTYLLHNHSHFQLVIVGNDTEKSARYLQSKLLKNLDIVCINADTAQKYTAFLDKMPPKGEGHDKTTYYLCNKSYCFAPTNTLEDVLKNLIINE